jgi:hypothetical protein
VLLRCLAASLLPIAPATIPITAPFCSKAARQLLGQAELKAGYNYCIPDNVTGGQLQQIVQKTLRDHPEILHLSAVTAVAAAIRAAFPCQKPN